MWDALWVFLFGDGHTIHAIGPLLGLGLGAVAGAAQGMFQGNAQKNANRQMQGQARQAANLLDPWGGAFRGAFSGLQNLAAPTLNAIASGQDMAGQQAAMGLQAGLGRAGLGSTGLGASLGAGARAGAAFQGNQLRARILQDLLGQTQNIQATQGSMLAGVPYQPVTQNAFGGALGGTAGALSVLGSLGWNPFSKTTPQA